MSIPPFRPIKQPLGSSQRLAELIAVPMEKSTVSEQQELEFNHTFKIIKEIWNLLPKLITQINEHHTAVELRRRVYKMAIQGRCISEPVANSQFEIIQKEMDLLHCHIKNFVKNVEQIKESFEPKNQIISVNLQSGE